MGAKVDISGKRFGRLVAIRETERRNANGSVIWECSCDCGNTAFASVGELGQGSRVSCGCQRVENVMTAVRTHGGSYSKLYGVWRGMKERCFNKNAKSYQNYGGRGITLCDEWKSSFEAFQKWAENSGYRNGLTIDRIDNDKGYFPQNCRWIPRKIQQNNRRTNHYLEIDGVKKTVTEWAEIAGIAPETVFCRLRKGMDAKQALRG